MNLMAEVVIILSILNDGMGLKSEERRSPHDDLQALYVAISQRGEELAFLRQRVEQLHYWQERLDIVGEEVERAELEKDLSQEDYIQTLTGLARPLEVWLSGDKDVWDRIERRIDESELEEGVKGSLYEHLFSLEDQALSYVLREHRENFISHLRESEEGQVLADFIDQYGFLPLRKNQQTFSTTQPTFEDWEKYLDLEEQLETLRQSDLRRFVRSTVVNMELDSFFVWWMLF